MNKISQLTLLIALTACTQAEDALSSDVKNAVALCSSGIEITNEAELQLSSDIKAILESESGIEASASISNAIRGIAFTEEGLSNENVLKAYETYNECVLSDLSAYLGSS